MNTKPPVKPAATGGLKLRWQAVVTDAAGQTLLDTGDWQAMTGEHCVSGDEATIRKRLESFFEREVLDAWRIWVRTYALQRAETNNEAQPRNPDFADWGPDEPKEPDWNRRILADQYEPRNGALLRKLHSRVPWCPWELRAEDPVNGTDLPPPPFVRDR